MNMFYEYFLITWQCCQNLAILDLVYLFAWSEKERKCFSIQYEVNCIKEAVHNLNGRNQITGPSESEKVSWTREFRKFSSGEFTQLQKGSRGNLQYNTAKSTIAYVVLS